MGPYKRFNLYSYPFDCHFLASGYAKDAVAPVEP